MTDATKTLILTALLTIVTGVMFFIAIGIRHDTQEVLRMLRRGEKIDCRMSEMRGTQP